MILEFPAMWIHFKSWHSTQLIIFHSSHDKALIMQQNNRNIAALVRIHAKCGWNAIRNLSIVQKLYGIVFTFVLFAFTFLFIIYHKAIFTTIEAWKSDLLDSNWKWIILVGITAATSFPPLIGYASSVTLAGYVFGFWRGWAIAILGSLVGAGFTFIVYRRFLSGYAKRMSANNANFMALTKALENKEGMTLLIMIRFCPFPFSLSNAALSTIPSITFARFIFATFLATLRLTVHAFVGSRLASLAEDPNSDKSSRIVNIVSIVLGIVLGILTGYVVYRRTKVIANRLAAEREAEERQAGERDRFMDDQDVFSDDELV